MLAAGHPACLRRENRKRRFGAGDLGDAIDAAGAMAAGLKLPRPGNTARAGKPAGSPAPRRDMLSAMPLAVTHFTNSVAKVAAYPSINAVTGVFD